MIVELTDFQRYELQCYHCGKTIGYMSVPFGGGSDNKVVTGIYNARTAEHMPVCCPVCEEARLTVHGDI